MLKLKEKLEIRCTFPFCKVEEWGNGTFEVHVKSRNVDEKKAKELPFEYLGFDYSEKKGYITVYRFQEIQEKNR